MTKTLQELVREFWLKRPIQSEGTRCALRTVKATGNHSFNFWIAHIYKLTGHPKHIIRQHIQSLKKSNA